MVEYAEQSLKTPVVAPMTVPENELNTPPGGDPNVPPGNPADPNAVPAPPKPKAPKPGATPPKKSLDANGVYQPDDLQKRLDAYEAQGVTEITCVSDGDPCSAICWLNDGRVVKVGQPFPSGHILEPFHPNCKCKTVPASAPASRGKAIDLDERRRKVQARREYQSFMQEVL
jgi:hypothetical protein